MTEYQMVYSDTLVSEQYTCDDCGRSTSRATSSVWSDVLVLCDLHGKGRFEALAREIEAMEYELQPCPRCNGEHYIPGFEHVDDAVCFQCNWSGLIPRTAEQAAALLARLMRPNG